MSKNPSGAIDRDFDDAERDARDIIESNVRQFAAEIKPGDVVIDMVEDKPLFVRRVSAQSAVEFFDDQSFDLVTYKAHPWLPITADDTIFECVFLPTELSRIPTEPKAQTYDYPRGRLARVPIEYLWGERTRYQDDQAAAFGAAMLAACDEYESHTEVVDADDIRVTVADVLRFIMSETIVEEAHDRAKIDYRVGEDGGEQ